MDFQRQWTQFALQAEHDHFGVARIVKAHNEQIATLQERITSLEYLLSDIKAFAFNVNPNREQPKDTLEEECEELEVSIKHIWNQLAASEKRERILREGLEKYADKGSWTSANARSRMKDSWVPGIFGYDIAQATLKAAEEVKRTPDAPYCRARHGISLRMNRRRTRIGRMRRATRKPRGINGGRNEKTVL